MNGDSVDRSEGDVNLSPRRAAWRDAIDDAETLALLEEDARYFLHQSLSTPCLDVLRGASGSHVENLRGQRFLDFHGNSVHQVGHACPAVIEAVKAQLDTLAFCPRRFTNAPAVELARTLARLAPGNLSKVLLAPGGAAAMGMALKLTRLATGRYKTVSWWDAFHGASLDAIGVGGEALFRRGVGPLMPGDVHVPPPGAVVGGRRISAMESADHAEYVMDHEGDVAAFIAEPIRCTTVDVPPAAYWRRIRELCDRHGALLVFDEIPLGFGRTGRMFACEHFDVTPDILCLGKGLGGGILPLAAMVTRPELDIAGDVALGHYTHEKSPVACAAALAMIGEVERLGLVARAETLGARLEAGIEGLRRKYPVVGPVRRAGLLLGVEVLDAPDGGPEATDLADAVLYAALRRGLSFKVGQGTILVLMPPLTLTDAEADEAVSILDASLAEAFGRRG